MLPLAPLALAVLCRLPQEPATSPAPPPQTTPAPEPQSGPIVLEIVFQGTSRVTEESLRLQLRTRVGGPYSEETIDQDLKALGARFQIWCNARHEDVPGGVRVIFELHDRPSVSKVEFHGNKELTESKLLETLGLTKSGNFTKGFIKVGNELHLLVRKLEEKYQQEGYFHCEIEATLEQRGDEGVLVFHIIEGPKVHVEHVEFVGLQSFSKWSVRSVMKTSRSFLFFTHTYKPDELKGDVVSIAQFYWDEGYLDAKVAVESVTTSEDADAVDILIRIDEGRRYSIRSIRFEGNQQFSTDELMALVKTKPGELYRQTFYRKDRSRILQYYRHRGYIRATMPFRPKEVYDSSSALVDVVYKVNEDEAKRVRDVRVIGNTNTRDDVVRRELDLYPGDLFDGDELSAAEDRLRASGFFTDPQTNNPRAWMETERTDDPHKEDVVMKVEDGASGLVSLFGGIASGQGFFAGIDVDKQNFDLFDLPSSPGSAVEEFFDQHAFHGGGQRLHLRANPGNRYSNYVIEYTEPYLTGPITQPVSLDLNLHLNEFTPRFYNERTIGGTVTLGKQLTREMLVSLGLRNDRVTISHIVNENPPLTDLIDAEGGTSIRSLIAAFDWRRFDSLRNPTDGEHVGLSSEFEGGPLGAQVDAIKATAAVDFMRPLYETEEEQRHVLALRGAVAYGHGYGQTPDVPFFERFFAGGPGTYLEARSFEVRGLGPHEGSLPVGGLGAVVINTEYVFPLIDIYDARIRENTPFLRGLFFVDQGMLEPEWQDLAHGRWRVSVGAGIRMRIPVQILSAPLEIYYGIPIQRAPGDSRESFQLSFSTRF